MGSDLQLTGLASGFDWKPVVEQLVELEAIPKRRLQSEKSSNEEKISDLGLLKSQLDALNGAAGALNNDDLYEARKVGMDSTSAALLSASAAAGALTGDYVVSVYSIGTQTEMSSKNRVPGGLGAGLNLAKKLNELPLQSTITTGTFTIAGKTLSIDRLDVTLQSIIDEINTAVAGVSGVNPESDTTGITFEYDSTNDRMIVDGGELSPGSLNSVPVLGSPTDTSNFLHVLRLLNRANVTRNADLEAGSGISVWSGGGGTQSWLRLDDPDETLSSADSRLYVAKGAVGSEVLYKRVGPEALHNSASDYTTGNKVYKNGFVYRVKAGLNFPTVAFDSNSPSVTANNMTKEATGSHWKLLTTLSSHSDYSTTGANFGADADNANTTINHDPGDTSKTYKTGDIVKGTDGNFFRAVKERLDTATVNWDDLSTDFAGANGIATTATANGSEWSNNIPNKIRINGRMYQYSGTGYSAVEHSGKNVGSTLYGATFDTTGKKYVIGKQGDATAQANYYKPNQTKWDTVQAHAGTTNRTNWNTNDYVQIGSKFYQATSRWDPTNAANPAQNELFALNTTSAASYGKLWVPNSYIQDTQGAGTNFFKAAAAWTNVGNHTGASTVQTWAKNKVVHNSAGGADKKFYESNANFSAIQAHSAATLYQTFNNATLGSSDANLQAMLVEDGTSNSFYKTGANWGETVAHTAGNAVTGFDTTGSGANNKYAKIGSVVYEAKQDFSSMAYDKSQNYTSGTVVYDGSDYFQATANVANHVSASGSAAFADASAATTGTRFLHQNGPSSKVWKPTAQLTGISAHASNPTGKYNPNNVVKGASNYFKASANWTNVSDHISGGNVSGFGNAKVVHNSGNNTFYQSQGDLSSITNWTDTNFSSGNAFTDTIRDGSGSGYYTPKYNISNGFINTNTFNATDVVKEGGNYYQFQVAYSGNYSPGVAANAIVRGTDGKYYQNQSGGANSNDPAPPTNGAGWSAGFATLDALQTGLGNTVIKEYSTTNPANASARTDLWDDVTTAADLSNTGHAQLSTYWQDATAIVATGTAYWTTDTDPLALSAADGYWTEDTQATTPATGGSGVWTNVTNKAKLADVSGTAGAGNGLWAVADASTLAGNTNWWVDVNNDLTNPSGTNDFWTDKTTAIFDFADIGNGNDVDTYWGSSNVNAELTDDSNAGFSNWWTDKTTKLTDLTLVSSDAETQAFWSSKTAELTDVNDSGFSNHWTEYGHATSAASFDTSYWQQIKPGMKRIGSAGAVTNAIDYSIWAKAGNVAGYSGSDGKFGTRDSGEDAFGRTIAHDFSTTFAGASANDIVKGSDGKYYRARTNTSSDPTVAANADDWDLIADSLANANKHVHTDSDIWEAVTITDPDAVSSPYWEQLQETVIQSSQALGTIDMKVSLASANFGTTLIPNAAGNGNFFIGEGEGSVRIDYNVNTDTVATLIDKVNTSDANVHMYYDPVSDRFVVRNKESGSVGITLHESNTWDALTANSGTGNLLNAMGLAALSENYVAHNSANNSTYANGTYVSLAGIGGDPTTFWQALQDAPGEDPSSSSSKWRQVIPSVGRAMVSELGQNSTVRVNQGDLVYSNKTVFTDAEHGYDGITFDIAQAAVNDSASFVVARDSSQAKAAIEKLVEEFNDAQDYIKSLTSVTNDGENVSAGKFSSNIEISRLGSQLRKVVFGDSTPHSQSGTTSDGANLIINERTGASAELIAIATDLNFDSNNDGYVVKVLDDNGSGTPQYWEYTRGAGAYSAAEWTQTDPVYSSFRLSNIGLDFGIGSDRIIVKNSALLLQELEKNPDKVKALFSDARVEATKTAVASDLTSNPKTLNNNDPNNPTGVNAVAGDTIANTAAFDANTSSYRSYQGVSQALDEFISAFLSGDDNSGYRGAYNTHIESIRSQNKRIDERIEDMERYLEQREKTLSDGFMRMEEMQSQLNTQLQTLQNSFNKK